MAQTSTWAVPSAPSGLAMRNTVNTILDVLRSSSSGAAAPSPTVAGMFWFDESVSPAVLRIRNASNTAWIRIVDTADAAASRSAIGAPPTPLAAAGLGQWANLYVPENTAMVLPAGGTWSWFSLAFNSPAGTLTSGGAAGITAGGATILSAQAGRQGTAIVWRIA